jgi:hypothetical protein
MMFHLEPYIHTWHFRFWSVGIQLVLLQQKGFTKIKFIPTKATVAAEIKRHDPRYKPNVKSKSLPQPEADLAICPLKDKRDIEFVKAEEARLRSILVARVGVAENDTVADRRGAHAGEG